MRFFQQFPIEIVEKIEYYLYQNTRGDRLYRKKLLLELNTEIKRQFCFNCRRYFQLKKIKCINRSYINNFDNIMKNMYNNHCYLELSESINYPSYNIIEEYSPINHWMFTDIKIKHQYKIQPTKYVKLSITDNYYKIICVNVIK